MNNLFFGRIWRFEVLVWFFFDCLEFVELVIFCLLFLLFLIVFIDDLIEIIDIDCLCLCLFFCVFDLDGDDMFLLLLLLILFFVESVGEFGVVGVYGVGFWIEFVFVWEVVDGMESERFDLWWFLFLVVVVDGGVRLLLELCFDFLFDDDDVWGCKGEGWCSCFCCEKGFRLFGGVEIWLLLLLL